MFLFSQQLWDISHSKINLVKYCHKCA
jgi:hypothetical protein